MPHDPQPPTGPVAARLQQKLLAAFAPALWDAGDHHATKQNPGDNPTKFRTIVALLKP